jgi:hypothetical protein
MLSIVSLSSSDFSSTSASSSFPMLTKDPLTYNNVFVEYNGKVVLLGKAL